MGLNLKLHAEDDININITTDDDTDPVEDQIEEQETSEAVEETSEEMETVAKFGMNIVAVIDNLTFLKGHVEKFGVSKQFLHLCNGNGQLNAALGISLPHYESDDIAEDVSLDDIPETDVIVEDFKEKIGNAYEAVKKFFKMIWDKIKGWFSAIFGRASKLKKNVQAANKRVTSNQFDVEKFEAAEANFITKESYDAKVAGLEAGATALVKANITSGGITINIAEVNKGLGFCGKKMVEKDGSYAIEKEKNDTKTEKKSMKTLGWTVAAVKKDVLETATSIVNGIQSIKGIEGTFKKAEAEALKAVKDAGGDGQKDSKKKITSAVSAMISALNSIVSAKLDMADIAVKLANKLPIKAEK